MLSAASLDNGLSPDILERLAHWQADVLQRLPGSPPLSVNEILRWPGAMQSGALSQEALNEATLAGIRATLDELVERRQREGAKLKQHTLAQHDKQTKRQRKTQNKTNHKQQTQKNAQTAQKADIDEELSRLATHFS